LKDAGDVLWGPKLKMFQKGLSREGGEEPEEDQTLVSRSYMGKELSNNVPLAHHTTFR
jgi:hypothetical protein